MTISLHAAWIGLALGCLAGAVTGLFFHDEAWLGGYAAWRRRMVRLGHVAFFGIGFLNLSFGLTSRALGIETGLAVPAGLLIVGAVTMPLVCYLSAWKRPLRPLFFVPALSVTAAVVLFLRRVLGA
jgi:hypothetical protein